MTWTIKLANEEIAETLGARKCAFPKYTTQIMNLANGNAQGTRPRVVGQMSELIQQFPGCTLAEWEQWYGEHEPRAITEAADKVYAMVQNLREAVMKIDEKMVREWVRDLVVTKTFVGMRFQSAILKKIATVLNVQYKPATPEDESRGIDGYLHNRPVSVKPETYKSKRLVLPEDIEMDVIYYEKRKDGITVEAELSFQADA